jgi:Cu+-exporting ATPase
MAKITHIVFDKTGTLTQHRKSKITYEGQILNKEEQEQIANILSQANHPATRAICEYLEISSAQDVQNYKLTEGQGVEAWINEHYYKLGSPDFVGKSIENKSGSYVCVSKDGEFKGVFNVSNVYRFGIFDLIQKLKNKFNLSVISGDNDSEALVLSNFFSNKDSILFHQKPQDKMDYIQHLQSNNIDKVMMIGDGLNDAGALLKSDIGIAVTDSDNTFTPASDGIIDANKLAILDKFLLFARDGYRIIGVSFLISIIYNVIGLYFAVQGILSPFIAAILMPTSSISIVLITYGMSECMAKYRGLKLNITQKNQAL